MRGRDINAFIGGRNLDDGEADSYWYTQMSSAVRSPGLSVLLEQSFYASQQYAHPADPDAASGANGDKLPPGLEKQSGEQSWEAKPDGKGGGKPTNDDTDGSSGGGKGNGKGKDKTPPPDPEPEPDPAPEPDPTPEPDPDPVPDAPTGGGTASGTAVDFNADLVNQLDSGSYWYDADGQVAQTISFGFTTDSSFSSGYGEQTGWSAFTESQKAATREIMRVWDDLIAPSFVENTDSPNTTDIKFSNTTTNNGYAHAYFPGQVDAEAFQFQKIQGSVWLNPNYNSGVNNLVTPTPGIFGYMAIAHEVGHALGLDHAGNYNGGSPVYGDTSTGWLYEEDSREFTIMSYFNASYTGAAWNGQYAQTPMVYDILAIQQVYGADYSTRAIDTTYGFNATAGNWLYDYTQNINPIMTIWDGNGTDTIDLSGWSTSSTLSLVAGSYSSVNNMTYNLAIAYDVDIENAVGGSGDDTLIGNDLDNVITGNAGNDTIEGHFGNDTLYGGDGDDMIWAGAGDDIIYGGEGADDFIFGSGETGYDVIMDFQNNLDALDFAQYDFGSDADVLSLAYQSGSDTRIALEDGSSIVLAGFDYSQFDSDDFVI